jgi:hypothetical protein
VIVTAIAMPLTKVAMNNTAVFCNKLFISGSFLIASLHPRVTNFYGVVSKRLYFSLNFFQNRVKSRGYTEKEKFPTCLPFLFLAAISLANNSSQ